MIRLLSDPTGPLRRAMPTFGEAFTRLSAQLQVADLWWVAPDMSALAVSSARTLPNVRWTAADRPSPVGLLVWDGGIGSVPFRGVDLPVDAVSWGPSPDGGLWLWLWIHRGRISGTLPEGIVLADGMPPLLPAVGEILPVQSDPCSLDEIPDHVRTPATTLAATWLLAQQPTLSQRTRIEADKSIRRAYSRTGRLDPEVTLVDLRRRYVPTDPDADTGTAGRRYRHRWVVSGHWRDQPCGPDRERRRRIWIADHIKGPEGAPMLGTTRVNVWRR